MLTAGQQQQCHLAGHSCPQQAGLCQGQTPGPRLPLALQPWVWEEHWRGLHSSPDRKEPVGLACRSPPISFQAKQGSRSAGSEGVLWLTPAEQPLGGTLPTAMTKGGLEAKSYVTEGVDSWNLIPFKCQASSHLTGAFPPCPFSCPWVSPSCRWLRPCCSPSPKQMTFTAGSVCVRP